MLVLAIFLMLLGIWYYWNGFQEADLTELRYNFTEYMTKKTDSYLNGIECEPSGYSLNSTEVCFDCNGLDACFGYVWVDKVERMMMSPDRAPVLRKTYDEDDLLDFHSFGVSSVLGCRYDKDKEEYECEEGVKAKIDAVGPEFEFPVETDIEEKIEEITGSDCVFTESAYEENVINFECNTIVGIIISNKIVIEDLA